MGGSFLFGDVFAGGIFATVAAIAALILTIRVIDIDFGTLAGLGVVVLIAVAFVCSAGRTGVDDLRWYTAVYESVGAAGAVVVLTIRATAVVATDDFNDSIFVVFQGGIDFKLIAFFLVKIGSVAFGIAREGND